MCILNKFDTKKFWVQYSVSFSKEQLFFTAQRAFCYEHSHSQYSRKWSLFLVNCLTKLIIQLIFYFSIHSHLFEICDLIEQVLISYEHRGWYVCYCHWDSLYRLAYHLRMYYLHHIMLYSVIWEIHWHILLLSW